MGGLEEKRTILRIHGDFSWSLVSVEIQLKIVYVDGSLIHPSSSFIPHGK
jgi:hypothetical protein